MVASRTPPTGDLACNQACALNGDQAGNLLVCRPELNPLSRTSQGAKHFHRRQIEISFPTGTCLRPTSSMTPDLIPGAEWRRRLIRGALLALRWVAHKGALSSSRGWRGSLSSGSSFCRRVALLWGSPGQPKSAPPENKSHLLATCSR